jgi:hypothetical protein
MSDFYHILIVGLLVVIMILLVYHVYYNGGREHLGTTFGTSFLENQMDKVKDKNGYTMDDIILTNGLLTGRGYQSPF